MIFGSSGLIMSLAAIVKEIIEKKIDKDSEVDDIKEEYEKQEEEEKRELIEEILRMGARTDLYQIYQLAKMNGKRSDEETELFNELFDIYKTKYNGNSYAEEIRNRFLRLPQENEE